MPLEEHEGLTEACRLGREHDGRRQDDHTPLVVLDTNVFVGAGFNPLVGPLMPTLYELADEWPERR
jgi:hypothetical protein